MKVGAVIDPILDAFSWDVYSKLRGQFAGILDSRCYTMEWLDGQILGGAFQLWAAHDAALITEIKPYPTGAIDVHVMAAAGNLETIIGELRERAEEWSRAKGCLGVIVESRIGWGPALKKHGYRSHQFTVRKEF